MAIGAVMIVTVFVGINISTWTSWVWWTLGIEILLIWVYTVSFVAHSRLLSSKLDHIQAIYSVIKPGWFPTPIYGNDHYLFHSAYYWLGLLYVVPLALLPRLICKAYKFIFDPSDIDRVRYLHKLHPEHDFRRDREAGGMSYIKRAVSTSRGVKRRSIMTHGAPRAASRTDMSTGLRTRATGFDFAMEENGVALRRLQSNLSGATQPVVSHHKRRRSLLQSISRTIRRKKVPSTVAEDPDEPKESKPSSPKQ